MDISKKNALRFVVLLGLVSLLADVTYEGARSITGPFLLVLGASATAVGFIAGFGELVGYGLRLVSGYVSDKTGKYWTMTIVGYFVNLLAVPLLAFTGRWEIAAALIILERTGKAIRTPARDAMLSHTTKQLGSGWVFGLHEAMDQIGAILGPLIVAATLYFKGNYKISFAILSVPVLLALTVLLTARFFYPRPRELEINIPSLETKGFKPAFWIYLSAVAFVAAGYADFPLVAYHFKKTNIFGDNFIPVLYAIAMGTDALAALLFGRLFDKIGIFILAVSAVISSLFAPLVFLGNSFFAFLGVLIWGIGMGAQESIMRAAISSMAPVNKRGTAYGIFNMGFGIFWFLGSALMGFLYDISLNYIVIFSVVMQLGAVPLFILVKKYSVKPER